MGTNSIKPAWGAIFAIFAIAFTACISQAGATPALSLPEQPLAFEANHGQTNPQVAYLARGKGYMLFLEPTEAILALKTHSAVRRLSMRLLGAASRPPMHPAAALPGRHNYYIGNDPRQWHTGIPTYARVVSRGVYPGIDMIYHGKAGQLEYDFHVAPGADPRAIRLAIAGSDTMTVNARGDLVLKVGGEQVIHRAPYAYQIRHGAKVAVDARYRIHGRTVAFQLGDYDHRRPLIIDPTLIYGSYVGGTGDDTARAVAVDASGNIYITGKTASTDLPQAGNTPAGGYFSDAFVTKLNSSGAVVFSTYIGSGGSIEPQGPPQPIGLQAGTEAGEKGNAIAVSSSGMIYITGGTAANATVNTFPTLNPYQACRTTNGDAFVTILDGTGNLYYSTCIGGGGSDEGLGIATDDLGNAYVVGYTTSTSSPNPYSSSFKGYFPTTSGALQSYKVSDPNVRDSFFFKLDPSQGSSGLVYSTYLGSGLNGGSYSSTYATAVAVDNNDIAYVAGWTQATATELAATGFPKNAYQGSTTNDGSTSYSDAFVYKIDPAPAGSASYLLYGTFLGGNGDDRATGIAVDGSGNIYVAGQTTSTDFPASSTGVANSLNDRSDGFIAKINPNVSGSSGLLYASYLGGNGDDGIQGIAVNSADQIFVTGWTEGGFPITNGSVHYLSGTYALDAFLTGLDTTKTAPIFSTYYGGNDDDMGRGIALARDGSDKVYIAGSTLSTNDLPLSSDAAQTSNTTPLSRPSARWRIWVSP
ncbi:MAG: SBBP repeat-containing protein [Gammaproteobacteria bacterium]